jgi:IS30 family transposase
VTSLVERVSGFAVLLRNNNPQSQPIVARLIGVLQALPYCARRSLTFDRGTDFSDWPYLQAGIGSAAWSCDPQSLRQKGTVENTNAGPGNGFREMSIRSPLSYKTSRRFAID